MIVRKIWIAFIVFTVFAMCFFVKDSQAIRLTLKRVVFEGSKRAEVVTVINSSDKAETYRLGWRYYEMTTDESLVSIPDEEVTPDMKMVEEMVRFAPRRFTVPPKSSQQVRMMLRMPGDLPDGEYRGHFWMRPEEDIEDLRAKAKAEVEKRGGKGGVSIQMLAGVTMPVIIRKGNLTATADLAEIYASNVAGNMIKTKFSLLREGDKSIYGDLDFICNPDSAGEYSLKTTRGIAIYTEVNRRNFDMDIKKPEGAGPCNSLGIEFTQVDGFKGKDVEVLARKVVTVN